MIKRRVAFADLKNHAWYGGLLNRLKVSDRTICEEFIDQNDHLNGLEFEYAVNRMFLGKELPKRGALIQELLTVTNLVVFPLNPRR